MVVKGQTVGIIEAMKLMNEIEVRSRACCGVSVASPPPAQPDAAGQQGVCHVRVRADWRSR